MAKKKRTTEAPPMGPSEMGKRRWKGTRKEDRRAHAQRAARARWDKRHQTPLPELAS